MGTSGPRSSRRTRRSRTASRSPDRRFRFSHQVALLTVATVVLVAILVGTALGAIRGPERTSDRLTETVSPAAAALAAAIENSVQATATFAASLEVAGDERSLLITQSQRFGDQSAAAYERYLDLMIGAPGEQELNERYESLREASQAAGARAFGLADSPDAVARQAAVAEQAASAREAAAVLNEILLTVYVDEAAAGIDAIHDDLGAARRWVLAVAGAIALLVVAGGALMVVDARRHERVLDAHEARREEEERRANLETQLQRGLEMEPTEESTHEVLRAALVMVRPDEPVELLVADSSRAHFHQAFSTHDDGKPGCPVTSPAECPATAASQTRVFTSSTRLDACPYLRNREEEAVSATCVPVNIAGTTGVFHTTRPDGVTPDPNKVAALELIARKAGERIGYLRVLARSEMQARVDPLTGLFNRRNLEDAAHDLVSRGDPFVVLFADLDHFKQLNDTHAHEIGDRALRLFGRVLRDSVRPTDVPARYGGEEFVVLLPDTVLPDARIVADRIRDGLRAAVASATVPEFTVSIGLAAWESPEDVSETIARADDAMLHAKRAGRDRVETWVEAPGDGGDAALVPTSPTTGT